MVDVNTLTHNTWRECYQELKKHKVKEGHCNVPFNCPENKQLGIWVMNQRTQNRLLQEGNKSTMTGDRNSLLESIGFVWEIGNKETWMQHFRELKKYATKEGHCNVPYKYPENK